MSQTLDLKQLTIQCNNSYHSKKFRAVKLQNWWAWHIYNLSFFIAPVQSDCCRVINIKNIILHVLLNKKLHFLGLPRGTGHKKIRNILGNLRCQIWKQKQSYNWLLVDVNWLFVIIKSHVKVNFKERNNNNTTTQRKIKVSHSLVIVFQWLFILLINCF